HLIDLGAESSGARASLVSPAEQVAAIVPVVEVLAAESIPTSVEAYDPVVVQAALFAGASVVNLTGSEHDDQNFALVAEHKASLVLCHVAGSNAREIGDAPSGADPFPELL